MPPCDTHFGRSVARLGRRRPCRRALPREALFAPFGAELRTLHGASRIRGAGDARPAKRGETHIRRSLFRQPPARAGRREDRAARVVARGRGSDPRRRRGRQVEHNARNATALFARGNGASARRVGFARRIRLRDSQFAVLVDASVATRTSVALRGGRGSDMALCLRDGFLAERDALGDHVHGVAALDGAERTIRHVERPRAHRLRNAAVRRAISLRRGIPHVVHGRGGHSRVGRAAREGRTPRKDDGGHRKTKRRRGVV